jgi:hypothetical protein
VRHLPWQPEAGEGGPWKFGRNSRHKKPMKLMFCQIILGL